MKPVNRKDASGNERGAGVDVEAVLDRMYAATGESFTSHAEAFGVPEGTLKTWRHRGEVSLRFLRGFAAQHDVPIDYLLHGQQAAAEPLPQYDVLTPDERALVERYRASSPPLRRAALRVLMADD